MIFKENSFLYKFKYLSYFFIRAFLFAIFSLFIMFGVLCIVYFGDLFLNVKKGNYNSPIFNGYIIVSQSMVPTINIKDAIIIKRDNDNYNIGDIISFFSTEYDKSGIVVTHRIVDKVNNNNSSIYTTKGDNNPIADYNKVSTNDVFGKVLFIIPKLGYYQDFLSKPTNFIICLLVPITIVVVYDVYRIIKSINNYRNLKKEF